MEELKAHQLETLHLLGFVSEDYEIAVGELIQSYIDACKQLTRPIVEFSSN